MADPAPHAGNPLHPPLWLLVILTALGPFTLNVVMPMMPALAEQFDADYAVMQLVLTIYLATTAVATLVLGALSDRFGRRPVILISLLVFLAGCVMAALAESVTQLVAARILQAVGGTAGLVVCRAIIYDVHGRARAASLIGYVTMAMVVAPMLAPIIGGFVIQAMDWRMLFLALGAVAVALMLIAFVRLGETRGLIAGVKPTAVDGDASETGEASNGAFSWAAVAELVCMPKFWGLAATLSFASGCFFSFLSAAPYVVVTLLKQPETVYGFWFVVVSGGYMLGNFITGRVSERLGPERMIAAGCALGLLGALLVWPLAHIEAPIAIFLPMSLIAISNGMTLPNVLAASMTLSPRLAGTASGLAGAIQLAVGAGLATIVGSLMSDSADPLRYAMLVCMLLSTASFATVIAGTGFGPRPDVAGKSPVEVTS